MLSLYKLGKEQAYLEAALEESGGEVTPEIEVMIESLSAFKSDKLEALSMLIKNAWWETEAYSGEIARLAARKKAVEQRAEKLEAIAKLLLPVGESWVSGIHKLSYRKSAGIDVIDQAIVPAEFLRTKTTVEVDKTKAATALKCDPLGTIPGLEYNVRYNLEVK